jgi:hypothetical protein
MLPSRQQVTSSAITFSRDVCPWMPPVVSVVAAVCGWRCLEDEVQAEAWADPCLTGGAKLWEWYWSYTQDLQETNHI